MIVRKDDGTPWYEVTGVPTLQSSGVVTFAGTADDWLQYTRRQMRAQVHRFHDRLRRLGAGPTELQDLAWATYASNVYREQQEEEVSR